MPATGDNLRINSERLWGALEEMAQIGPGVAGGNNRQTLTDADGEGRHLFQRWCQAGGMTMGVDTMGNMFATRPGTDPEALPVYMGSHLDTQPTGGKYDGVLGVLGALEVVRTLNDMGVKTRHPIVVTNWTNEEGARFAPAMLASGVFAGILECHRRAPGRFARASVHRGGAALDERALGIEHLAGRLGGCRRVEVRECALRATQRRAYHRAASRSGRAAVDLRRRAFPRARRGVVADLGGVVLRRRHRVGGAGALVGQAALRRRARAPDHADHLVALREEELGEVGAVLAGDAGDERARGHGHRCTRRPASCLPTGLTCRPHHTETA